MKNKIVKHLHVLTLKPGQTVRGTPFANKIFNCQDPDCWFYASSANLIGKRMKCPLCLKDYVVSRESLTTLKTPHCFECTKSDKVKEKVMEAKKTEEGISEYLNRIGIKI